MNKIYAFGKLGLHHTSYKEGIKKNYYTLIKKARLLGATKYEMVLLQKIWKNELPSVYKRYLIIIELLDKISIIADKIENMENKIDKLDRGLELIIREKITREALNIIIRENRTRIRLYRNGAILLAFLAGLAAFSIQVYFPDIKTLNPYIAHASIVITILFIGLASLFNGRAEKVESNVEDISDRFSNKKYLIKFIKDIILENEESFTREQAESIIAKWIKKRMEKSLSERKRRIKSLARKIGSKDFIEIIIKKGIEKELLNEDLLVGDEAKYTLMPIKDK